MMGWRCSFPARAASLARTWPSSMSTPLAGRWQMAVLAILGRPAELSPRAEPGEVADQRSPLLSTAQSDLSAARGPGRSDCRRNRATAPPERRAPSGFGFVWSRAWRGRLLAAQARLEAAIDFPDEDLPADLWSAARGDAASLAGEIAAHLADGRRGEMLRDGLAVAIVGPPNAGKSSLLNALARREVAITAATAGTTRDVIEVALDLGGYPVVLADTAGLRAAADAVEEEGVRRARARAADADLKLVILDATRPWERADVADFIDADALVIANKIDLLTPGAAPPEGLALSVRTGAGMDALLARLGAEVAARLAPAAAPLVTRARHRQARRSLRMPRHRPDEHRRPAGARRRGFARRRPSPRPHHRPGRGRGHARSPVRRILHRQMRTCSFRGLSNIFAVFRAAVQGSDLFVLAR